MPRYRSTRHGGVVYQAGMDMRERGAPRPYDVTRSPQRAIVVETYVTDSADHSDHEENQVEADIILVRSGLRIDRVPVSQPIGYNNANPWVPRKTTRTLSGDLLNLDSTLSKRGTYLGPATALDDVDGDTVLVDFIEGDFRFPIINGMMPHTHSLRNVIEGEGWAEASNGSERGSPHDEEHYFRFAGFEMRVNKNGDVLLDTVGATNDTTETEDPANGNGQIRLRVKNSERFTVEMDGTDVLEVWKDGSQVKIDMGENADEQVILGNTWRTFFNNQMTKLNTFWTSIFNTHTHTVPMGGSSGPPGTPQTDTIDSMPTSHLSNIARTKS